MAVDIQPILDQVDGLCATTDISKAIFQEYLKDESFPQHHEVLTEVRNGQVIPIIDGRPNYGYLKVTQGNCQNNVCDVDTTSTSKRWGPVLYDCRLTICKQNLDCDFRKFWNMRCHDFDNMEDAFIRFLADKVMENVNASQWRIGYFDDSANVDPLYAGIDGLFKQWTTIAPVGNAQRIEIPENDLLTIAEQMALDPTRGYEVLKAMFDYVSVYNPSLLSTPGLHFDITPALAYNYLAYLRDNKEVNCCFSSTDGITSSRYGAENLNYLGIPINIRHEWTNIIEWQQSVSGAAAYNDPHRAVLTYRGNKPVGTCDSESFNSFDMFYDRKDKEIIIDTATSFDAKVVVDNGFMLAM